MNWECQQYMIAGIADISNTLEKSQNSFEKSVDKKLTDSLKRSKIIRDEVIDMCNLDHQKMKDEILVLQGKI